jgi:hypothetical protein
MLWRRTSRLKRFVGSSVIIAGFGMGGNTYRERG